MAWKRNWGSYSGEDDSNELKFDLRLVRAKLIGQHMSDVYEAQVDKNYMEWYRHLNLLHTASHHLIENAIPEWSKLKKKALEAFNTYTNVYLNKSNDPEGVTFIEEALSAMERHLLSAMEENGVFGKKEDVTGL